MTTKTKTHIRWQVRKDLAQVMAIEKAAFDCPWTPQEMIGALRKCTVIGMVATCGTKGTTSDRVLGYMLYELHRDRIHLLNLAVRTDSRRHGVGEKMVAKLLEKLSPSRRYLLTVDVRETNLPAQLFFSACGLRATGINRGAYDQTNEEAYRFEYVHPSLPDELI